MAISAGLRFQVLGRDEFTCQYCGRSAPDVVLHVDHIHPRSRGGQDVEDNLITACAECNHGKRAKHIAEHDQWLRRDYEFVRDHYTDNPVDILDMVRRARTEALSMLIESISISWFMGFESRYGLKLTSDFELYLLAGSYYEDVILRAMREISYEIGLAENIPSVAKVLQRLWNRCGAIQKQDSEVAYVPND